MPEGMGETLKQKAGPLPIWAWAVVGTGGVAFYMYRRNQKAAAAAQQDTSGGDQSNLGTVPISNLSTSAQPMPIQMGDTFVNVNDTDTPDNDKSPTPPPPTPPPPPKKKPVPPPPVGGKRPTPPPKPTPPKPTTQTVTVCPYPAWCGSLYGIAQHFYGNGNLWPTIYNANKAAVGSNPNLIHVGLKLTIPPKPS